MFQSSPSIPILPPPTSTPSLLSVPPTSTPSSLASQLSTSSSESSLRNFFADLLKSTTPKRTTIYKRKRLTGCRESLTSEEAIEKVKRAQKEKEQKEYEKKAKAYKRKRKKERKGS